MPEPQSPRVFLAAGAVDPAVFELRPGYRALLLVVDGLDPEAASSSADDLIARAEAHARALLAESSVEDLPHVAAGRDAHRALGAEPQRTRNSLEVLTRRAEKGLPRVNALTDIYNAVSALHQVLLGGEDFHRYAKLTAVADALTQVRPALGAGVRASGGRWVLHDRRAQHPRDPTVVDGSCGDARRATRQRPFGPGD